MTPSWKSWALASAVFAGLTAVFAKIGVQNIPSNLATWVRTLFIVILLTAWVHYRGEWQNPTQWSHKSILFLALSALATGISWVCYYRALQLGPASLVSPIDKLSLVVTVIISVLFLGERLSGAQWLGALMMASGAILIGFASR